MLLEALKFSNRHLFCLQKMRIPMPVQKKNQLFNFFTHNLALNKKNTKSKIKNEIKKNKSIQVLLNTRIILKIAQMRIWKQKDCVHIFCCWCSHHRMGGRGMSTVMSSRGINFLQGTPKTKSSRPSIETKSTSQNTIFLIARFPKKWVYPIAASLSYDFDCPFKENNAFVSPLCPPLQKLPPPPSTSGRGGGQPDRREYRGADLEPALWH